MGGRKRLTEATNWAVMGAKKNQKWVLLGLAVIAFLVVVFLAAFTEKKTPWDVLELLVVPFVLAIVAIWFNNAERQKDREVATDHQHEVALQNYLDKMSDLLLKENLLGKKGQKEGPVLNLAKARTVATLRTLDEKRRNILLQFLRDATLCECILEKAFLDKADLRGSNLEGFCMSGNILNEAILNSSNLTATDLSEAQMFRASLKWAVGSPTILNRAFLREANLSGAFLADIILRGANLREANLTKASLREGDFTGADLTGANLIRADLTGACFDGAELTKAKVTQKQLARVKSLKGATMPDGTVHE